MEHFFQKIKAWYAVHFISRPANECKPDHRLNSDHLGWKELDVQISQDTWLRNSGMK